MATTLAKWTKQPGEILDYDVSFVEFLALREDTIAQPIPGGAYSVSVDADPGITIEETSVTAGIVKVWLSGGTDGESYKVTVKVTTTGSREKHAEFTIKVKEI